MNYDIDWEIEQIDLAIKYYYRAMQDSESSKKTESFAKRINQLSQERENLMSINFERI